MAAISLKNLFFLFRIKSPTGQRSPFRHLADAECKECDTRMSRIVLFSFSANEKTSSRLVAARRGKKGRL